MALTSFQNELLRLLAKNRIDNPEIYVAGGLALRAALAAGELTFHEGTIGGVWPRIIG